MKILWFEVTIPKKYKIHDFHGAGWQDSLESVISKSHEIELAISFEDSDSKSMPKKIEGVSYFPISIKYSFIQNIFSKFTTKIHREKLIPSALEIVNKFKPDVIHIFGSEWSFGQIAEFINIPVIIHFQGSIPPYNNAFYPPGYNFSDEIIFYLIKFRLKKVVYLLIEKFRRNSWSKEEEKTISIVNNYFGRTNWDKNIINYYNSHAKYFKCEEALRPEFIKEKRKWKPNKSKKLRLITVGCSTFWKGIDTVIKTAKLLKDREVEFEWVLAGKFNNKEYLEWKEGLKINDLNIIEIGMIDAKTLIEELLNSSLYIHTAYIDNSPNSICEAQIIGIPVIATFVGGIPSLITNGVDGVLIPANDPYTLYSKIIQISNDFSFQLELSNNSIQKAEERHNVKSIESNILNVYNILRNKNTL